nr:MFS transporter [Escherichia coli]
MALNIPFRNAYYRFASSYSFLFFISWSLWWSLLKWHTEFGHLNRGDMLTSEQHRCSNEKKKFQRRV